MKQILIDTNILIDFSKGYDRYLQTLFEDQARQRVELCIIPIIAAEFLNDHSINTPTKEKRALEFLSFFKTLDITKQIGEIAGKILRAGDSDYIADAFIAATSLYHKMSILTRNKKHFRKIKDILFV